MKLRIKESKIAANIDILAPWLAKAQLGVDGYEIDKLELTIPTEDVTIADFQSFEDVAAGHEDYSIYIEIPNQHANNNVPASLSFSTYTEIDENDNEVTIQRKISDLTVSRAGPTNTIYYLQGITSKITKSDLDIMVANAVTTVLSASERSTKINDPDGEYYVEQTI